MKHDPTGSADPIDAHPRARLAHLPTPIINVAALDRRLGCELWIKRDDCTGGAESGNKLRKLELLLARAIADRCDTVLTCGGLQSNHARATALACARLGLRCVLFLRMADPSEPLPLTGNVLLDRFAGAEIRRISVEQYRDRDALMANAARGLELRGARPFVVPEGGSNGLGALGYVLAMREVRRQLDLGLTSIARSRDGDRRFDVIAHACGSGGTAAGVALGAARHDVARDVRTFAVCDDTAYFTAKIRGIIDEARTICPGLPTDPPFLVDDQAKGPAYAVATGEQRAFIVDVARASGLVLDPVYTGKALFGLAQAVRRGDIRFGARVLFLHTGGLPGLLADPEPFRALV
ncbi:MAG: D-cysteine desulfhydrase family protein [Deltaproteobacteria bacterium]|nr:D-cysteine desulfhydrase family protein [Deltaproteobacteria bacterium]